MIASITQHERNGRYPAPGAVTAAGEPEDGQAHPSGKLPVATYMIGPDEWLLLAPPPGAHPATLRRDALAWLGVAPPSPGGSVEFVPVPPIDPVLGLAVLHHRPGRTAVYCGQDNLGAPAAETLSLIAVISTPVLLTAAGRHGPPRTRIIAVSHGRWLHPSRDEWLHPSLHPVIAHVAPPQATIYACDCQVAPALADVLTTLYAGQLRLLHARGTGSLPPIRLATLPTRRRRILVADSARPSLPSKRPGNSRDELHSSPCAGAREVTWPLHGSGPGSHGSTLPPRWSTRARTSAR